MVGRWYVVGYSALWAVSQQRTHMMIMIMKHECLMTILMVQVFVGAHLLSFRRY